MGIAPAAVVAKRLHAGDTDTVVDKAFAPGTSKCIGNENRNVQAGEFFELAMEAARGEIRVNGKKQSMFSAVDVRNVHAAVGTYETVMGFGD